jgi:competence protein ComEA
MDPETIATRPLAGNPWTTPRRDADAKLAGRRLNINTATQAELEALRGVGPVIARRIIEGRPCRSVDELHRFKGIGKKRLEEIRPLVAVE